MLRLMNTLLNGARARAEEQLTDACAIDLIDQKIREAQSGLRAGKTTLATLMQQRRLEAQALSALQSRIEDLTERAGKALAAEREDLAFEAAAALADLENEQTIRNRTLSGLDQRIERLKHSLDKANRRIIDLKQGAIGARAVHRERRAQAELHRHATPLPHITEAEELIARVLNQEDPFERAEILAQIDAELDHSDVADRLSQAGFGKPTQTRAEDVLARLKTDLSNKGDSK